jgi:hypothetical protein
MRTVSLLVVVACGRVMMWFLACFGTKNAPGRELEHLYLESILDTEKILPLMR